MVLDRCSEKTFIVVSVLAVLFASVLAHRGSQSQSGNVTSQNDPEQSSARHKYSVAKVFLPQDFPADTTFVDRVGVHHLTGNRAKAVRETFKEKRGAQATYIIIAFSIMPHCNESSPSCKDSNFTILHETEQIFLTEQKLVSNRFYNLYCKDRFREAAEASTYIHYPLNDTYTEDNQKFYFVFKCGNFTHDDFELLLTDNASSEIEAGRVFHRNRAEWLDEEKRSFFLEYGTRCPLPGHYFESIDIGAIAVFVLFIIVVLTPPVARFSIWSHEYFRSRRTELVVRRASDSSGGDAVATTNAQESSNLSNQKRLDCEVPE